MDAKNRGWPFAQALDEHFEDGNTQPCMVQKQDI